MWEKSLLMRQENFPMRERTSWDKFPVYSSKGDVQAADADESNCLATFLDSPTYLSKRRCSWLGTYVYSTMYAHAKHILTKTLCLAIVGSEKNKNKIYCCLRDSKIIYLCSFLLSFSMWNTRMERRERAFTFHFKYNFSHWFSTWLSRKISLHLERFPHHWQLLVVLSLFTEWQSFFLLLLTQKFAGVAWFRGFKILIISLASRRPQQMILSFQFVLIAL